MAELELLSEHREVAEGPGTILRKVEAVDARPDNNYTRQLKLIAGVGRTLLSTQSLSDVLNKVVDHAFAAVPAERAFLMLRESADQALTARVLRHRDGSVPPKPTLSRMVVRRVMRDRVAMLAADAKTDPGLKPNCRKPPSPPQACHPGATLAPTEVDVGPRKKQIGAGNSGPDRRASSS